MTTEEKFKDVEERVKAFDDYCGQRVCDYCKHSNKTGLGRAGCVLHWLADEYKGSDLPFKVVTTEHDVIIARNDTGEILTCKDKIANAYRLKSLCADLNAAAVAWHKRLVAKGECRCPSSSPSPAPRGNLKPPFMPIATIMPPGMRP